MRAAQYGVADCCLIYIVRRAPSHILTSWQLTRDTLNFRQKKSAFSTWHIRGEFFRVTQYVSVAMPKQKTVESLWLRRSFFIVFIRRSGKTKAKISFFLAPRSSLSTLPLLHKLWAFNHKVTFIYCCRLNDMRNCRVFIVYRLRLSGRWGRENMYVCCYCCNHIYLDCAETACRLPDFMLGRSHKSNSFVW